MAGRIVFTAVGVVFLLGGVSFGAVISETHTATDALYIPVFDNQASGWLTGVRLDVSQDSPVSTSVRPNHRHTKRPSYKYPRTLYPVGAHDHSPTAFETSGNGLTIASSGGSTSSDGDHWHSLAKYKTSSSFTGAHSHAVDMDSQTMSYSGSELSPFLLSSDFSLSRSIYFTGHNHHHSVSRTGGNSTNFGHNHSAAIPWKTVTTFTYDPNDNPLAIGSATPSLDLASPVSLTLDASSSSDPDAAYGDSIVQYGWDLDNDNSYDFYSASSIMTLESAQWGSYFTAAGSYTIGLSAEDELGYMGYGDVDLTVVPEPSAAFIIWSLLGTLGITGRWRRRKR